MSYPLFSGHLSPNQFLVIEGNKYKVEECSFKSVPITNMIGGKKITLRQDNTAEITVTTDFSGLCFFDLDKNKKHNGFLEVEGIIMTEFYGLFPVTIDYKNNKEVKISLKCDFFRTSKENVDKFRGESFEKKKLIEQVYKDLDLEY